MKKVLFNILLCFAVLVSLTGCNASTGDENDNNSNTKTEEKNKTEEKSKGNCTAVECINKIEVTNTVEEINKIIGFDGELTSDKYNRYYWKLSENTGVQVTYYSSDKGNIVIDYERDTLKDKKVDLSKYDEIKGLLKSSESLTYDQFVSKVGNVQGHLIEKSSMSKRYVWVDGKGAYLTATFSVSSGKCTIVSGRV